MGTKNLIISLVLALILPICLLIIWSTNNYLNEKQLNEDLANRFDKTMTASLPLIRNLAQAAIIKANMFQKNATIAHNDYPYDYSKAFAYFNRKFSETEDGRYLDYWLHTHTLFITSVAYGHLERAGSLRAKESKAFLNIHFALWGPEDALEMDYESLISECEAIKKSVRAGIKELDKYHSLLMNQDSWTSIGPTPYRHFQRYYKRKNWPFNFSSRKNN